MTPIDVRIIAACNKNLLEEVEKGRFRRDLYYRLYVLHLDIPPLRARDQDIMELIYSYLKSHRQNGISFSAGAIHVLLSYSWPGNIRELNNFSERVSVLYSGRLYTLEKEDVLPLLQMEHHDSASTKIPHAYIKPRRSLSPEYVLRALEECNGNKTAAAKRLGISTTTLWRKLKCLDEK